MIKWAGWIMVLYGTAHTLGALVVEGAALHAGAWFTGQLWHDDLAEMSPANSALWLSLDSFGIPLVLIGATIVWMDRKGITPPAFIGWVIGLWTLLDAMILLYTPWPIMLVASTLLVLGVRRERRLAAWTEKEPRGEAGSAGSTVTSPQRPSSVERKRSSRRRLDRSQFH